MNYIYVILGIIVFIAVLTAINHRRMKALALERGEPNICAYARSFDYRNVDTKIMREVYNLVQEWAGKYDNIPFPVQADDTFDGIYRMDPDDLDDIYFEVAEKLGISKEDAEANPYYDKVETVKDLVLFLNEQPRVNNA
jgi:acyl carrier protein